MLFLCLLSGDTTSSSVNELLEAGVSEEALMAILQHADSELQDVKPENMSYYLRLLERLREEKGGEVSVGGLGVCQIR